MFPKKIRPVVIKISGIRFFTGFVMVTIRLPASTPRAVKLSTAPSTGWLLPVRPRIKGESMPSLPNFARKLITARKRVIRRIAVCSRRYRIPARQVWENGSSSVSVFSTSGIRIRKSNTRKAMAKVARSTISTISSPPYASSSAPSAGARMDIAAPPNPCRPPARA